MSDHPIVALIRPKLADPTRPFNLIATLEAHEGSGDELAAVIAASKVVQLSRQEAGCLGYDIGRDADAPDRFVVQENWRDLAALETHLGTAHFGAIGKGLGSLLAMPPKLQVVISIA